MSGFISSGSRRLTPQRFALVLGIALAATALIALVMPLVGSSSGHLELFGLDAYGTSSPDHPILWVRLPRLYASLVTGAALAGAGCALQALLRNPLAEPFTLGISSGSSLAAVLAIRL